MNHEQMRTLVDAFGNACTDLGAKSPGAAGRVAFTRGKLMEALAALDREGATKIVPTGAVAVCRDWDRECSTVPVAKRCEDCPLRVVLPRTAAAQQTPTGDYGVTAIGGGQSWTHWCHGAVRDGYDCPKCATPPAAEREGAKGDAFVWSSPDGKGVSVHLRRELPHGTELFAQAPADAQDAARLLWIAKESGIDGFGEMDIHEQASIYASAFGRDEPNDNDYIAGIRDAIDKHRQEPPK